MNRELASDEMSHATSFFSNGLFLKMMMYAGMCKSVRNVHKCNVSKQQRRNKTSATLLYYSWQLKI